MIEARLTVAGVVVFAFVAVDDDGPANGGLVGHDDDHHALHPYHVPRLLLVRPYQHRLLFGLFAVAAVVVFAV